MIGGEASSMVLSYGMEDMRRIADAVAGGSIAGLLLVIGGGASSMALSYEMEDMRCIRGGRSMGMYGSSLVASGEA